jgi:WD40 repeat protein
LKTMLTFGKRIAVLVCTLFLITVSTVLGQNDIEALRLEEVARFGTGKSEQAVGYENLLLSPNEEYIAVIADEQIEVWNVTTQSLITIISNPFGEIGFGVFAWSPDSSQIASIALETELYIWDAVTGELLQTLDGIDLGSNGTRSIEWHQPNTINTGSFKYLTWDIASQDAPRIVDCHPWGSSLWWSPNDEYVATMGGESTLVWICDNQFNQLFAVEGYTTVEWSPDSTEVANVGIFNTLRIWSITSGEVVATAEGGANNILNISWHSNENKIVTGHVNGEIRVWERLTPDAFWLIGNAYIPGLTDVTWIGNQLLTATDTGILQVWDINSL